MFMLFMLGRPGGGSFDTRYAPERVVVVEDQQTGLLDVLDAPGDTVNATEIPVALYQRRDDLARGHLCGSYADGARRGWTTLTYTLVGSFDCEGQLTEIPAERAEQLRQDFERDQVQEFLAETGKRRTDRARRTRAERNARGHGAQGALF